MSRVPVGKCSLIAQLSTCRVAFPPFLVKRTTWYFPSFTGVLLSSTLMSTVPMLNVTPIFPCCWNEHSWEQSPSQTGSHYLWCPGLVQEAQRLPLHQLQYSKNFFRNKHEVIIKLLWVYMLVWQTCYIHDPFKEIIIQNLQSCKNLENSCSHTKLFYSH